MDYKAAGVNIDAGNETVRRIRDLARSTFTPAVLSDIGSFGGLYRFDPTRFQDPVLVSSADGVGTKLKVALLAGVHDTVGADLVNHCVNDILVQGAEPLFFLDYLATGRLEPRVGEEIVRGLARACRENACALLGGETAEMPGFYGDGEYDVAGFIVGVVDREALIDGSTVQAEDVIVGLESAGLHTNGYSLARAIAFDRLRLHVTDYVQELESTIGAALLAPHRSYLRAVYPLVTRGLVKGMAHITGGGITENLPRILPEGVSARIDRSSWMVPQIFQFLGREGDVPQDEMFRTFNMGLGLLIVCASQLLETVLELLRAAGEHPRIVGHIESGPRQVVYEN